MYAKTKTLKHPMDESRDFSPHFGKSIINNAKAGRENFHHIKEWLTKMLLAKQKICFFCFFCFFIFFIGII
jgi:hypothetical protein